MWEDFMRGNWPAAAAVLPAESPARWTAADVSAATAARPSQAAAPVATFAAADAGRYGAAEPARPVRRSRRPLHRRRMSARLAAAFGAG